MRFTTFSDVVNFFVIMFSLELCVCIYDIIACMFSVLNLESKGGIVFKFILIYLQLVFVIAFFGWISWLSSRNRKEPMRFSLVISTVIMCILLDMIMDFFQVEGYEELGTYLDGLREHLEQADCSIHVGNEIADAILSEKNSKAQAQDIRLNIEGDMYGVALAALDICTIFSNMLDNAMEAVSCLSAEQRVISVSIRKNNHFLLIHENNYTEVKPVIVDGQIKSTKKNKDRHGFGIPNIKEAAAKYDGDVQIAVTENEDGNYVFVMEIMIPY